MTDQNITMRPAEIWDAEAIARIHVDAWKVAYRGIVPQNHLDALSVDDRRLRWRKHLQTGERQTLVAVENEAKCPG